MGQIYSGAKLGSLVVILVSALGFAYILLGSAGQYYMANWLWILWFLAGLSAGLRSGYLADQKGWLVGLLSGISVGTLLGIVQYIFTGWLEYAWQIVLLAAVSGFLGGTAGINIRLRRPRRLGRQRMFYHG